MMTKYANRGMKLEQLINKTNKIYYTESIADIRKIDNPVKILKTSKRGIVTGHLEKPKWVDYCGIYRGQMIIFDAKETAQKSWPLSNISDNQYNLLKSFQNHGAISFLIINFTSERKYYYVPFSLLEYAFQRKMEGGRKSISIADCEEFGEEVYKGEEFGLNYLGVIG